MSAAVPALSGTLSALSAAVAALRVAVEGFHVCFSGHYSAELGEGKGKGTKHHKVNHPMNDSKHPSTTTLCPARLLYLKTTLSVALITWQDN